MANKKKITTVFKKTIFYEDIICNPPAKNLKSDFACDCM